MAQPGVVEKTEPPSGPVPGQAGPAEGGYIGVTTAFGKTVFIADEGGLQTLRLGGSALTCGYTWGRAGPGPREVARAILIDATGNEMLAERLCRPFTWEVVSKLPADEFRIARADVLAWVEGGPVVSSAAGPGRSTVRVGGAADQLEALRLRQAAGSGSPAPKATGWTVRRSRRGVRGSLSPPF